MESPAPGARYPVQEQRARWERKRSCTARELLETERRYQEQLGLVATVRPVSRRGRGPQGEGACLRVLRGNFESQRHPATTGAPGPLWALGTHLRRQPEQLKKNKHFRRFVRLQEGRPEFAGLQLQDLLPLPLQRLQQYENFAVALAENTSPNSPDHKQLTRAAQLISETAQRVHTIAQKQKNEQHLQRVQALLSGRQAKGLISGRWFLRQGWLLVVPPRGEPRPRMFFLFSDALLMAKPRPPLHLLQSGTFACRALYPMAECQLHRVFGHSGGPCGGLLSQPEELEESYKFQSPGYHGDRSESGYKGISLTKHRLFMV
ncbi:rho guanine nucleotide exchange factor 39 isoform X3 [Muntiacus reevesi]|uniref:rho guanine nucleotide exchange factor 39 isoform X3 n=1 Tax=Muntiacus reevesi TaxID=9886 RepID=UPI0033070A77